MPVDSSSQLAHRLTRPGWRLRDWIVAPVLFAATAAVVLWQNAHVAVLWDLAYVLDSAARIATGQMPYRDFPLVHAPLTFLVHAAIIRLTGRMYFHHVLYVAAIGGMGTAIAWRLALNTLRGRIASAWMLALLLAAPLAVLGLYCIFPFPSYDCDCAFWMLVALWLLQSVAEDTDSELRPARKHLRAFLTGAALCLPLFFKQNMGLPFLATAVGALLFLLAARFLRPKNIPAKNPSIGALLATLAGVFTTIVAAALLLHFTAGIDNYILWTIRFAAQRRMPGLSDMLGVYLYPSLVWMLPCVAVALALLLTRFGRNRWAQFAAFALMAAPFLFALASLVISDDIDERGDTFLELWPLLLIVAAALALTNLVRSWRNLSLRTLLPFVLLVAINGTMMSQQLWGSTYAIWPMLMLLLAEMLVFLDGFRARGIAPRWFANAFAALVCLTFLVCGRFYTASEDRLSYVQFPDGPEMHSAFPELAGMATPGPYLPEFDELLRYAQANIPVQDGLILIPGEDPFYFVTGRVPQFPVLLFDKSTDPYSPVEVAALVRMRGIHWLIVKRDMQINGDPMPDRDATIKAVVAEFTLAAHLRGYDVYRR